MTELPGLIGSTPIGYLAALGLLRGLTEDRGLAVRLGWWGGRAVLDGPDSDEVVDELLANMEGRGDALEFTWSDSTRKVPPELYRGTCLKAAGDRRALGFLAGWGTDTVLREGAAVGTRMDMTSGRQKLLADLRKLAPTITRDDFVTALHGGAYSEQPSFGLDPVAIRSHANESEAPTKSTPPGKPGQVWLAFESIPLHPVLPVSPGRAQTTGWRYGNGSAYVWALWDGMLGLDEVAMLRALPVDLLAKRPGVREVWASRYGTSGKYGMLFPARRER